MHHTTAFDYRSMMKVESSELTTTVGVGRGPPTFWMIRRHKPETNNCPKEVTEPIRVTKRLFCF